MTIEGWLTIAAIVLGPVLAVQAQKWLELSRENRARKTQIFKTLMATRGAGLSAAHVEGLNRIDLEFSANRKYSRVIEAWKEYFDHLCVRGTPEQFPAWSEKGQDLLARLLQEMGVSLGFKFDRVQIKRNAYAPQAHADWEHETSELRKELLSIVHGRGAIRVKLETEKPPQGG